MPSVFPLLKSVMCGSKLSPFGRDDRVESRLR
jgi:hypothetical protein